MEVLRPQRSNGLRALGCCPELVCSRSALSLTGLGCSWKALSRCGQAVTVVAAESSGVRCSVVSALTIPRHGSGPLFSLSLLEGESSEPLPVVCSMGGAQLVAALASYVPEDSV